MIASSTQRAAAATPNLDRLAAGGVVLERALTSTPLTLPAHASMLTGLLPHREGRARSAAGDPGVIRHPVLPGMERAEQRGDRRLRPRRLRHGLGEADRLGGDRLAGEKYLYLFLDGTNLTMRRGDEIVKQCVLVVIGVTEARERRVLALQAGDRESASAWTAVFQDLIGRGLDPSTLRLAVMDGLPGLEKAFRSAFRRAKVQRCQFHKAGNVLAKVRRKDQAAVKADLHEIFRAGSRLAAKQVLERFSGTWKAIYPDPVACVERDFDALIAFLEFPENEWVSLRTTNGIERLNKEFKRRTKPMEIAAGEASVYGLLAFVAMKMELSWSKSPFRNSGFRELKPFAGYFTHGS